MLTYDEAVEKGLVYVDKDFIFDTPQKRNIKYYIKYLLSILGEVVREL